MVIDIYYWFDKSMKRKALLAEFYSSCDVDYHKIVKHVNTRWLSLERAVTRVLQQFPGLKSYFLSNGIYDLLKSVNTNYVCCALIFILRLRFPPRLSLASLSYSIYVLSVIDEHEARFGRLQTLFENPMRKFIFSFTSHPFKHSFILTCFYKGKTLLSRLSMTTSFLQNLASKFLTVAAIKEAKGDFSTLYFKDPKFQHPGKILYLYPLYTELLLYTHHWHWNSK
jgi:hypothetical protein